LNRVNFRRRILPVLLLSGLLLGIGTIGYMMIEGWSIIDSFYMAVITITTVGFGEVRPLSGSGRLFTVILIFSGVSIVAYGFSTILEYILTVNVGATLRRRRMGREIDKLQNHVIVCGYGRVGKSAVASLKNSRKSIVVIDKDPELAKSAFSAGVAVIEGDSTNDEVLIQAGIERAWGIMVCTGDDSLNLFVVLSARALNANLYIVVRTIDADNERKMRRAGANRVVSPYQIGGQHMANIIVRPHVTDFFDVVTLDGGIELWVEELRIEPDSEIANKTVGDADIRRRTGVTLIALLRQLGGAAVSPDADTLLTVGDELIVIGTREQLTVLERLTGSVITNTSTFS
jgi:voltage-gated potassium channel